MKNTFLEIFANFDKMFVYRSDDVPLEGTYRTSFYVSKKSIS